MKHKYMPTLCGCRMEPVNDQTDQCDLCSEATESHDGTGWVIVHCRLHAAAPELLAACKAAQQSLRATSKAAKDYTYECNLLRDAIAKATDGDRFASPSGINPDYDAAWDQFRQGELDAARTAGLPRPNIGDSRRRYEESKANG